jgi:hypothetical protein
VVSSCARGFASLPYWYGITYRESSPARRFASAMAPFDPSAPGESITSAPNSSAICRRSVVTLSGMTSATR